MKLVKIKLINWHIFQNHTIELNGNTLITGENGCGKSTLMDAIYFVLSGGDSNHFNKAANDGGQRTLETYVRGKLGGEKNPFLRSESEIISYVILEFKDEKDESLVLGSEIESFSINGTIKTHFFVINDYKINDDDFIKDKKPISFRELKYNFKDSRYSLTELDDSYKNRRTKIGRDVFKITDYTRFFELLKKAISFHPIGEVSTFVNEFLLEEDNINLDSLRDEIRSYQELHKTILKEEEKINFLETFIEKAEKYQENEEKVKYLKVLQKEYSILKSEEERSKQTINLNNNENEYKNLENEYSRLETREQELNKELSQLENNEEYKALLEKKNRLNEKEIELKVKNNELNDFSSLIKKEQEIINSLGFSYRIKNDFNSKDYNALRIHSQKYKEELYIKEDSLINERATNNVESNNLKETKKNSCKELDDLKKGINNYPEDVINLIELAKNAIREANPRENNIIIRPFCEYIEILNKEWSNALEGYLNTQRFNIIVDPKYYDIVSKAFNKERLNKKVYLSGIVNVNKIPEKEIISNSMMNNLEIKNEYAYKYARYLLGDLACCNDVLELKNYKSSITKEVMIYKNYVLKACNPKIYEKPFIGRDSIKVRINNLENYIKELDLKIECVESKINEISKVLILIKESQVEKILNTSNLWNEIDILNNDINSLKEEIKRDEDLNGLFGISEKIRNCEINIKETKDALKNIKNNQGINRINYGKIQENLNSINNSLNFLKEEKENLKKGLDDEIYKIKFNEYLLNNKLDINKINQNFESFQKYNNSVRSDLINKMSEYSKHYKGSLTAIIENLSDYINEYYTVKNLNIVEYKEAADNAFKVAEKSFKEDFISKLKEKIEKSQKTLNKINKNLALHPFGNDEERYKFYYEPTKNSEFYNYYRIIMSGKMMESTDLFTETLDEKERSYMNDLFNKISMETSSTEEEILLSKYLDYRNYMNYDIKITNKYGEESYFSKISKEKSGGETQTPFYIVIASCFDELMNNGSKELSTCVVVFDEAFNNMDEGRIKSLMEFYKELNIELIIIVPSNRISSIAPYMDTCIGIYKKNNYPFVQSLNKEKIND